MTSLLLLLTWGLCINAIPISRNASPLSSLTQDLTSNSVTETPDYEYDYEYPGYQDPESRVQKIAKRIPFASFAELCRERVGRSPPLTLPPPRKPNLGPTITRNIAEMVQESTEAEIPFLERLDGDFSKSFGDPYFGCRFLDNMRKLEEPGGQLTFMLSLMDLFLPQ